MESKWFTSKVLVSGTFPTIGWVFQPLRIGHHIPDWMGFSINRNQPAKQ